MTTTAVTFYDVVLWLHISAVIVGFGSTFAYGVLATFAAKDNPRSMPSVLAGIMANDRSLVTFGGLLVLVTGFYLVIDRWDFGEFFIGWGIIAVLFLLGITHGYLLPNERRAKAAAERDIERAGSGPVEFGEQFNKANGNFAKVGTVAGIVVVLTVYVMTAKPFL